jgi:hypothetical protein
MIAVPPVRAAGLRSFFRRHRFAMRDLSVVTAGTLVALYWVYAVDLFTNAPDVSAEASTNLVAGRSKHTVMA